MKKLLCLCMICFFLLSGCTLSESKNSPLLNKDRYVIEQNARLHIVMDDAAYAKALATLWNMTYPKHKDALHITISSTSNTNRNSDIEWLCDQDIAKRKNQLFDLDGLNEHIQYHVPQHLERDEQYFLPVEGKGLVFVYNEETLQERGGTQKDVESFERLSKLSGKRYYHNREADYVYPFLFTPHEEVGKDWLNDESFYENLVHYRQLNQELSMVDDAFEKNTFYEGDYICGLMRNDGSYIDKDVYKRGKLHVRAMPKYHGKHYAPIVDTYGFGIHKNTKYPGACMAFLQLVRSEKGMQALIKHTSKTPLIDETEAAALNVFVHTRKEIIFALNASQLRDLSLKSYLKDSSFYSIIENSLYTKESNKQILKKLDVK